MITNLDFHEFTFRMIFEIFSLIAIIRIFILVKKIGENPALYSSYHFNDFSLKNNNAMKVLKFLGIQPIKMGLKEVKIKL